MDKNTKHSTNFPYIVIRLFAAVYKTIHKPIDASLDDLITEAKEISQKKNLKTCVVIASDKAYYVEPNGKVKEHRSIPSGGLIHNDEWSKENNSD